MPVSEGDEDELVEKAAEEIRAARSARERAYVARVTREYGVSRQRVVRRLKGIGARSSRKPLNYKLSSIQEAALIQYIRALDGISVGLRLDQLKSTANSILKNDHIGDHEPGFVGPHWP
jgi:hypothetical protein